MTATPPEPTLTLIGPESEPEPELGDTGSLGESRSPAVDWAAHRRSLRAALEAAGLTQELPQPDSGEECGWADAMAELTELAETMDVVALQAEVKRLRNLTSGQQ